jgi:hypothetical protein
LSAEYAAEQQNQIFGWILNFELSRRHPRRPVKTPLDQSSRLEWLAR